MIRCTLPDGSEVEVRDEVYQSSDTSLWVEHHVLGWIGIDRDKLTEVPPSLPQEPPDGTALQRLGALIAHGRVWFRCDMPEDRKDRWWGIGMADPITWEALWKDTLELGFTLVELRSDPADDAPELPWTDGEDETEDKVHVSYRNVYVHITPGYITAEEAEVRAAVILRAAREARRINHNQGD